MLRWMIVALLTLLVTFVTSSIYLRIRHVTISPTHTFWNEGTAWRDVGTREHPGVRFNRDRLVTDLVVLPFALLFVLGLVYIYESFSS
jgi:hypothetical protein